MKSAAIFELLSTVLGVANLESAFFAFGCSVFAFAFIYITCLDKWEDSPSSNDNSPSNDENSASDEIIIKKKNEPTSLAVIGSNIAIYIYLVSNLYELDYDVKLTDVFMPIVFTVISGMLLFVGFFYLISGLTKIFEIYEDDRIFKEKIYMSSVIIVILLSWVS